MNFTLDFRYLARLALIGLVTLVAIYCLHRRQTGKLADAYLHQANLAEERGDVVRTSAYLRRSLILHPGNVAVRARLALLNAETASSANDRLLAFLELEQVLRLMPENAEVRRRSVEMALDSRIGRYAEALAHLDHLLAQNATDATLHDLRGKCLRAMKDYSGSERAFSEAILRQPRMLDAYGHRAALLRQHLSRGDEADRVIKSMLQANSHSAAAHLLAAAYWKECGRIDQAADEIKSARRCDPTDPDVILAVARLAQNRASAMARARCYIWSRYEMSEACQYLLTALEGRTDAAHRDGLAPLPKSATVEDRKLRLHLRTAVAQMFNRALELQLNLDRIDEARATGEKALALFPENTEIRLQLVEVALRNRDWDQAEAQLQLAEQRLSPPPGIICFDRGRILVGRGQLLEATRSLERGASEAGLSTALATQIQLLAGSCYEQMGLLERSCAAYRRAIPADPENELWLASNLRLAAALASAGRVSESIRAYETISSFYPSAKIPLATLRFQLATASGARLRDWSATEEAIKRAPAGVPTDILRADLLVAQNRRDEAQAVLTRTIGRFPDAVEPVAALAMLVAGQGQIAQSRQILADAERRLGDRALLRLVRGRLVVASAPKGEAAERAAFHDLESLSQGLERFRSDERKQILRGLAEMAQSITAYDLANQLWDRFAREWPDDLNRNLAQFDMALERNDRERLQASLQQIRRIDGPTGSTARTAEAFYWIWEARQTKTAEGLEKARMLLVELERDHVSSGRLALAQALILDLQSQKSAATGKYREAIDLGERNPQALHRLIELYYEQQQYAEVEQMLRRIPEPTGSLQMVAAEVAIHSQNLTRALQLAQKAVTSDTRDYRKQIWLSHVLAMLGKLEEAEVPLRRAQTLAPDQAETWIALVNHFVHCNRRSEAELTIERAKSQIRPADAPLAIAQCYEIIGRSDLARTFYETALKERPNDPRALRSTAVILFREGKLPQSRQLLERLQKTPGKSEEDAIFASRLLNVISASTWDYQASRAVLRNMGLLDADGFAKPLTGHETLEELRVRAELFAHQRDLQSKREAIAVLEELAARRALRHDDQFLLACLWDSVGDWAKARLVMVSLLRNEIENPVYVAYFAYGLIQQPDLAEASQWIAKLEQMRPGSQEVMELRARLLAASGKLPLAQDLVVSYAKRKELSVETISHLAHVLEEIGAGPAAEPLYKQIVERAKSPEANLVLAAYYGRQNRLPEALDLCEEAWKHVDPASVASASVAIFYASHDASPDQVGQTVVRLEEALRRSPDSPALLHHMAALRNFEGNYGGAISFYRQAIARNPTDVLAVNNLAYLLFKHEGQYSEALQVIDRAKKTFGPLPTLLDTEAQVYVATGNPDRAEKLLNEVLALEPSAARYYHLAQAYQAAGRRVEAVVAWRQAQKRNLKAADLHPLERKAFEMMVIDFAVGARLD